MSTLTATMTPDDVAAIALAQTGEWVAYRGQLTTADLDARGIAHTQGRVVAVPVGTGDESHDSDSGSLMRAARPSERNPVIMVRDSIMGALVCGVYPQDIRDGARPTFDRGCGWTWIPAAAALRARRA